MIGIQASLTRLEMTIKKKSGRRLGVLADCYGAIVRA